MTEIDDYARIGPVFARILRLVRPHDGARLLLRLGGRSSDFAYWGTREHGPPFVHHFGTSWMRGVARLAVGGNLRVLVDTNLVVHAPSMAVALARTAARLIPRGHLAGIVIGNEPHLYRYGPYFERVRVRATLPAVRRHWTRNYSPERYRDDWLSYARRLTRALPGVPLVGPETGMYWPQWPAAIAGLGALAPGILTLHGYSFCACKGQVGAPGEPTIPHLLGDRQIHRMAAAIRSTASLAHRHGQRFQLTEYNPVCCGGEHGVSDSFATALFAPDALFEAVRAGADGIAFHIHPRRTSAAFMLRGTGIFARPELYAIAVWGSLIRPRARLMDLRVDHPGLHLKTWAVWTPTGVNVLLIDKGNRAARVTIPASPYGEGKATSQLLTAPSPGAVRNVTFGGRTIGSDARWHGRRDVRRLSRTGDAYRVVVPPHAAVVVRALRGAR